MSGRAENGKVLVITYEFPPMGGIGSIRTSKTVKYLPAFGWDPVVITVRDAPTTMQDRSLCADLAEDLDVRKSFSFEPTRVFRAYRRLRRGGPSGSPGRGGEKDVLASYTRLPFNTVGLIKALMVPDEKIGWLPFALPSACLAARETGARAIFSTAPPFTTHLVAAACKALTGLPWVSEFRDPLADYVLNQPPTSFNRKVNAALESMIVHRSDAVVCAMDGLVDKFRERYPEIGGERYHVVTGGYDPDDFAGDPPLDKRFTVTWVGSMYQNLCPRTFLSTYKGMLDEGVMDAGDCSLRVVGTLDVESLRLIRELGLYELIEFSGFVDHERCIREMRSSHLLLLQVGGVERSEMIYPGKMFEYMASRRPVLALAYEGSTARLVRELDIGTVVEPDDAAGIRRVLSSYYSRYRRGETPPVGDPQKIEAFDKRVPVKELAGILDLVSRRHQ